MIKVTTKKEEKSCRCQSGQLYEIVVFLKGNYKGHYMK